MVTKTSAPSGLRLRRAVALLLGSLGVHAIVLLALPPNVQDTEPAAPRAGAIELEVVASSAVAPAPIAAEPTATRSPSPDPARRSRSRAPQAIPPVEPIARSAETPEAASITAPRQPAPTAAGAPSPGLDLSPLAAARTVPLAVNDSGQPLIDTPDSDRGVALAADLRAAGSAEADALRSKRKLELRRDADGTCHYEGSAFNATIHPDGGVEFADHSARVEPSWGVAEPPAKPVTVDDTKAEVRVEASIKITPRAWDAERAWFMRETQGLRDELSDAALARELAQKELGLRRELDRIWCEESRPKPQRRRAIFELWTEMSGDEVGARGRRTILEYVRRNLPQGSEDAYTNAELTELNLERVQGDRFAPYDGVAR